MCGQIAHVSAPARLPHFLPVLSWLLKMGPHCSQLAVNPRPSWFLVTAMAEVPASQIQQKNPRLSFSPEVLENLTLPPPCPEALVTEPFSPFLCNQSHLLRPHRPVCFMVDPVGVHSEGLPGFPSSPTPQPTPTHKNSPGLRQEAQEIFAE